MGKTCFEISQYSFSVSHRCNEVDPDQLFEEYPIEIGLPELPEKNSNDGTMLRHDALYLGMSPPVTFFGGHNASQFTSC